VRDETVHDRAHCGDRRDYAPLRSVYGSERAALLAPQTIDPDVLRSIGGTVGDAVRRRQRSAVAEPPDLDPGAGDERATVAEDAELLHAPRRDVGIEVAHPFRVKNKAAPIGLHLRVQAEKLR